MLERVREDRFCRPSCGQCPAVPDGRAVGSDHAQRIALILGKGPTARVVPKSHRGFVAALNGAVNLVERCCDVLFVNDLGAFDEISVAALGRTERLVVPAQLHLDGVGRRRVRHEAIRAMVPARVRICCYELLTNPRRDPALPFFGECVSVGETAVAWLLAEGFRRFATLGIDPHRGYSPRFAGGPQTDKPADFFRKNWERMQARVLEAGGTIARRDRRPQFTSSANRG